MIEAAGLTKYFGGFLAIENVSFKVGAGEVVAFLGPNGAGKSTTMRILAGYLAPSAGTARIAGLDVFQHRLATSRKVGFLPENGPLYPEMTPRELLGFFAEARALQGAHARQRLGAVVEQCALQGVLDKPIRKLSRGYRQRVGMAHVLLHEPEVLIMDEPTSGLDPNQILHVRDTIRRIGETKTILLSTHILQEVEAVASRVILISGGRIVFDGTPGELRQKGGGNLDSAFHTLTGAA
ncbi:MAG: ABC transporter ATP-binding protein [Planctomycetes bacterium]|nr:ABC transporter ATP-binding protein [Planctomycetota bacterium]